MRKIIFIVALLFNSIALAVTFPADTHYRVCSTPGQQCETLISNTINAARKSIFVQAYSFTSKKIGKALIAAKKLGVKVYIILDKSQLHQRYSELKYLWHANIHVWIDNKVAIAHNKVMIIDSNTVITGSFNFTNSAQRRNAENVIIIQSAELADKYFHNWEWRKALSYQLTEG
jgi:phosphatidylserine/phosphatidylglycerophosphate/cardiolipin synthase-like enzyme